MTNDISMFQQMDQKTDGPASIADHKFGAAKHFMPLPHTVVGSHCAWQLRLNTAPTRIPGKTFPYKYWETLIIV